MATQKKNYFKFILGLIICLLFRLIPFRPPNVEPILATQMPFSGAYGAGAGFIFGFFSIMLYDFMTRTLGVWSFITAFTYGVLGLLAALYFKKSKPKVWDYTLFAIFGTLFFDAVTGLSIGPLFFDQSFMSALIGQIPFTLWHLFGNVSFALVLSPAIYDLVIENKKLESLSFINIFHPKKIL